jgi:hypothetical protein
MDTHFSTKTLVVLLTGVSLTVASAVAYGLTQQSVMAGGPLGNCIQGAIKGPERKFLKIFDHEFHCKPLEKRSEGNTVRVDGHVSHHLSFRPDDQVYYTFVVAPDGSYNDLKIDINRGGLAPYLSPIASAVGAYYGVSISPEMAETFFREAGRLSDGSWEKVAKTIVNSIAVALAGQVQYDNSQADTRRNPDGGPSGPDTCLEGFVWREAFPGDHVCVTWETRQQWLRLLKL